jgi:hypothetical protein
VGIHDHPLFARQSFLFEQHRVGNADLANVVEQAAPLERLEFRRAHAHLAADVDGDLLDALAVFAGKRVALVDRLREGPNGLGEHLPHRHVAVVGQACGVQGECEEQCSPPTDEYENLGHEPSQRDQCELAGGNCSRVAQDMTDRLASTKAQNDGRKADVQRIEDQCA